MLRIERASGLKRAAARTSHRPSGRNPGSEAAVTTDEAWQSWHVVKLDPLALGRAPQGAPSGNAPVSPTGGRTDVPEQSLEPPLPRRPPAVGVQGVEEGVVGVAVQLVEGGELPELQEAQRLVEA